MNANKTRRINRRNRLSRKNRLNRFVRHNQKLLLFVASLIIIVGIGLSGAINANAAKDDSEPLYKYFTVYYVESGDTLWSLAGEYAIDSRFDYIDEVKSINHLGYDDDKLYQGQMLVIPYYSYEYKE